MKLTAAQERMLKCVRDYGNPFAWHSQNFNFRGSPRTLTVLERKLKLIQRTRTGWALTRAGEKVLDSFNALEVDFPDGRRWTLGIGHLTAHEQIRVRTKLIAEGATIREIAV